VAVMVLAAGAAYRVLYRLAGAEAYANEESYYRDPDYVGDDTYMVSRRRVADYCAALSRKYRQAAWRPWMSLPPDGPCPNLEGQAGPPRSNHAPIK